MSCENACYEAVIESCNDIIIRAGFAGVQPLYWLIKRPGSNNLYQRLTTTNVEGDLVIPIDDLPAGFLIPGGYYNIQVRNGDNYLQAVTFDFGGTEYDCIQAQLITINRDEEDESEVNVIEFNSSFIPDGVDTVDGHEEFTGSTDLTLTLPEIYIPGSIKLYKNGPRLNNASFTEASPTTITLNVTRIAEDEFIIDYKYLE